MLNLVPFIILFFLLKVNGCDLYTDVGYIIFPIIYSSSFGLCLLVLTFAVVFSVFLVNCGRGIKL